MYIADLEFNLVEAPRAGSLPPVRSLLVRLVADSGREGWGEAWVPWRPSELAARRQWLLPFLAGRSVFDIEELHTLEALSSAGLRAALEMACWDLAGRVTGQPICRLLGGEFRRHIPLAARISAPSIERAALQAREFCDHGYQALVLVATGEASVDRQCHAAVSEAIGDRALLRIDGQASYTLEAARELCGEFEHDSIQFLLDPLSTPQLTRFAALARQTVVPIATRRLVRSPGDMLAVIRSEAAAHVVIDSEQIGGLAPAKACIAIATAARLAMSAGGRPSLGVATAAMLHLAAASPGLRGANESAYHQLLADVLTEPLTITDGMMTVPQSPGLGVEVDRSKVDRLAVG